MTSSRWWPVAMSAVLGTLVLVLTGCTAETTTVDPNPTETAAPGGRIKVAFIGDSYTSGTPRGGLGQHRWTSIVTRALEAEFPVTARTQAVSGSGYVAGAGSRSFLEFVPLVVTPQTRLVVVFGSRNDAGLRGVEKAAEQTFAAVRAIAPQAQLLVVGPPWTDGDPPVPIVVLRDNVREATKRAGVPFVDPLDEGWFAGGEPGLISAEDGVHPTDLGHEYLAQRMLPHLRTALARLPKP